MSETISMKKAAIINAAGKYSKVALSLFVNAILARILLPEDYGIVAVITVFSTFFTTFSDMGFGAAIIQKKELTKREIDDIFSFTVYVSAVLAVLFLILSYFIAKFYDNEVYKGLGKILSLSLLFNALNMVPNGILNREKKFVAIALRTIVIYVVSAGITIILAYIGLKYYAIAIQAALTAFFNFVWNALTTKPKFILKFNMGSIKKVLNYSGYQFAFNIVNYFSRNLDNLLTGKLIGHEELGYYNKAYTLMLYPVNNLTGVIAPVLHPILSEYQKQLDIIFKKYMKVLRLLSCIAIYAAGVCILSSEELIRIFYGNNWNDSIECFKILSIAIIPQMLNSSAGAIFQAINKTKLLFINSCINTSITVVLIIVGILYGGNIIALSYCVMIAYCFHFISAFSMLILGGFKYRFTKFIVEIKNEIIMLIFMGVGIVLFRFNIEGLILSFIIKITYISIIYIISLVVTKNYKILAMLLPKKNKSR